LVGHADEARNEIVMCLQSQSLATTPLRTQAIDADQASTAQLGCVASWNDLIDGSKRIVDSFAGEGRYYLVITDRDESHELDPRLRDVLERGLLRGQAQKVIALDLDLAVSTIAARHRQGLKFMGVSCSASRAPALLIMIGAAAGTGHPLRGGIQADFVLDRRTYRVLAAPSQLGLRDLLPIAEEHVVRLLLDGRTHAEIAAQRGTSPRTVANQLAGAFRKLGVSGRLQLLLLLCADQLRFERASHENGPRVSAAALSDVAPGVARASWTVRSQPALTAQARRDTRTNHHSGLGLR
jgi:DNA-binding NarL/FixJ family response regulator